MPKFNKETKRQMNWRLAPLLTICKFENNEPNLPQSFNSKDIWNRVSQMQIGPCDAWEFRHDDNKLLVIQEVAKIGPKRSICVIWLPSLRKRFRKGDDDDDDDLLDNATDVIEKTWIIEPDGTIPNLELDMGPKAMVVKSNWPATGWRQRLPTDSNGDPFANIPPDPATGPMMITSMLAT